VNGTGYITDVPGITVGHAHDEQGVTGCTVVLAEHGAVGGVDVRGSAPGTREIEALKPVRLVNQIHAILLTGGSAFGLRATEGIQRYLEEKGIGFVTTAGNVPVVPTAVIYDLAVGDARARPDAEMAYRAALDASSAERREGRVGVGFGATVGKVLGYGGCVPGGVGGASLRLGTGAVVGALVVVNALGDVVDPTTGGIIAGARDEKGDFVNTARLFIEKASLPGSPYENTTLAVVATTARLNKEGATKVAQMAQDGIARAIDPAHTMYDGDVSFALSVGNDSADVNAVGVAAADLVAESIVRAVRASAA
jgi:L-aminopeptidase/D-esterase-like protein